MTGATYFPPAPTAPTWTLNGAFAANSSFGTVGLLGTNSYISIIYNNAITPESISNDSNASEYEVNATLDITESGGSYIQYVRASSNAVLTNDSTGAGVGTFHAMEIQNPIIDLPDHQSDADGRILPSCERPHQSLDDPERESSFVDNSPYNRTTGSRSDPNNQRERRQRLRQRIVRTEVGRFARADFRIIGLRWRASLSRYLRHAE